MIPSYNTHFNSLETTNDSYQYPTNKMYFPNDDLSMDQFDTYNTSYDHDVNALIQSHHSMYYFPTAIGYIDNDYNKYIFNSPTSESDLDVSSFHVEQMQEYGCIYYSPDHYATFSTIV
ncbi:unnamed protein product [Rhizophagus irregularis]|nr:unnamed protein product [Rhizophagus irregularis]